METVVAVGIMLVIGLVFLAVCPPVSPLAAAAIILILENTRKSL